MTEILEVEPAPNNGTMGSLHHLLNHPKPLPPPATPEGMVENCPYPGSDKEYYDRIDNDMSNCVCVLSVSTPFLIFETEEAVCFSMSLCGRKERRKE